MPKLAVIILGHMNAGKSEVWKKITGKRKVVRGYHVIELGKDRSNQYVEVHGATSLRAFIVKRAANKDGSCFADIEEISSGKVQILFASVRYSESGMENIDYLEAQGYDVKVIWLNPDSNKQTMYFDDLGLIPKLLAANIEVMILNGDCPDYTCKEIKTKMVGWCWYHP